MKKTMTVIAVAITFAACTGKGTSTPAQDSTAVDTTVVVADSTLVADSVKVADTAQ